ncbi:MULTISPECIES: NUDIX hydrolase [unclassified Streptococcus]|uniref:NUDIX hydrolase n=1 Tax=unclassified Streptococcus TaxID=2608887 RepID=UPI001071F525|nr:MULTISPECIES: NUDIX hydrolase [unclassified Streptococcus]MBF0805779.1 NUDIX hydrolase [Streptococcus sp. 19428wA2_WM07]TFU28687.1 NUDIX hydrolase [Streptococcus sp. WM07]
MNFEEKTLSRQEIFKGRVFQVAVDEVELPDGKGTSTRELVFHNGAVCVLPITSENKVLLVKQYRKAIEGTSLEIPAGKLEIGENADPKAAALRELEEEIGYVAELELLYDFYTAIGFCSEKVKLYLARNLEKVDNPRPQDADETLALFELDLNQALEAIETGDICDAKTIMAIQYWQLMEKVQN